MLAAPFKWACVDVSTGSGANGTDVDDITVWTDEAAFASCVAFGFVRMVVVSNGDAANGTLDVWSGNGANGTYGANGTLSTPKRGWLSVIGCWTVEYPSEDDGETFAAAVVVSPDAAILRKYNENLSMTLLVW